jgi:hypothetical protein
MTRWLGIVRGAVTWWERGSPDLLLIILGCWVVSGLLMPEKRNLQTMRNLFKLNVTRL